jgi:hypothetical protein
MGTLGVSPPTVQECLYFVNHNLLIDNADNRFYVL